MRRSKVLEKLRAGDPALVTNASLGPSPMAVELAGRCGVDGVWIDMEHRPFTQREVSAMVNGARLGDTDAVIRVRKGEGYTSFFRPLEDGAAGIIVPHVTTRDEAKWVVRNAKYPPLGRRGTETVMPDSDVSFSDPIEYIAHANRETFVAVQIEDAEALDKLDEILSVEGIDIAFIGPADLTLSMGVPFQFESDAFQDAVKRIAEAAAANGKWWGLPCRGVELTGRFYDMGARFFNIFSDFFLLKQAWLSLREEFDRTYG